MGHRSDSVDQKW